MLSIKRLSSVKKQYRPLNIKQLQIVFLIEKQIGSEDIKNFYYELPGNKNLYLFVIREKYRDYKKMYFYSIYPVSK